MRSILLAAATLALLPLPTLAEYRVERLRCEYAADPLGVDVERPRLTWNVASDERGERQTAYQVLVSSSAERLARDEGDLWDSGRVESDQTVLVPYEGDKLATSQKVWWKARSWDAQEQPSSWSEPATWTMGVVDSDDWRGEWIVAPWQTESVLMRKGFKVRSGLKRATAHVSGLGQFEMTLNGEKSGDALLSPGWTRYNRTALYETHDVTPLLVEGENAVGLVLGDGMYHTERRNRFSKFQGTFGPQRAIMQIELEYEDGTKEVVAATDETWTVSPGPITFNDIFGGEDYDARRLEKGWDTAGFDDKHWDHAVLLVRPGGTLRGLASSAPKIAAIESIAPVATRRMSDSQDVVDLGQNASYMPRLTVSGTAGSTVRLTHAEVVHPDGSINRRTCGGNRGPAYWQYTKATDQPETYFPKFFYAGCRYLQVDKLPAEEGGALPSLDKLEGVVVHTTSERTAEFATANELMGRIRTLVLWAQRSNLVSVLTDCPHREKLGWLEQYHLNGPGVRYEFDASRMFIKGMRDMADAQHDSGLVPNIAPEYVQFPGTFQAAAEWGAAAILVPWQHYQATGDDQLLRDYYDVMKDYFAYIESKAVDGVVSEGLGDWYDLGPAERPGHAQLTQPPITATAFYYYDAKILAQIAELIDEEQDAATYTEKAAEVRQTWLDEYRNDDGTYATGSQCSNAIALWMGLAEEEDREKCFAALVDDVRDRGYAMTAGDVGFRYLLQALADGGRSDVVYQMINQDERPGYGYMLKQGATSLTEAWDANHKASHNHFMLGHVTEWFYKDLVGIASDPEGPGYKRITIRPNPPGDLEWAEATHQSIRGPIRVRWEDTESGFRLEARVPANTTATIYLPASPDDTVTERGAPVENGEHVRFIGHEEGRAVYEIDSGSYEFAVHAAQ
ncbi:Bacterial alpha-L-rhamnosidase [Pseudobythopirellula maris]|uniref:alpha-L-rhamnosidase n=1 Tax=Pseudobythopirellula maris TaxID=2527991 RepID=A0A5C5ZUI6_9BACT|nr:family 78 glycoside hydrolase catalytic domain [Pseudobythopirellula maris]TWT91069.1 Bacterial alpha-L-rhamnosidase [Pseudobythopirellula maris]